MTFRLCLVGNSHLGAYKRAWRRLKDEFSGVSISMYGAPAQTFGDLEVEGRTIVPTSNSAQASFVGTGGSDHVRLDDHDAVVVVGGGARLNMLARILEQCRPPFMNPELGATGENNGESEEERKRFGRRLTAFYRGQEPVLASSAMLETAFTATWGRSNALRLLHSLSGRTRLGHVATPLPAASILQLKPRQTISRVVELGVNEPFGAVKWQSLRKAMPHDVALIRPAEKTVVRGLLTDPIYSTGSIALDETRGAHADDDVSHMNEAYGEIMLRRVISQMCA